MLRPSLSFRRTAPSCGRLSRGGAVLLFVLAALTAASCGPRGLSADEKDVAQTFDACKQAILQRQAAQVVTFLPRSIDAYFADLTRPPGAPPGPLPTAAANSPGIDLLLRTAIARKVPPELRAQLTLASLLQDAFNRGLLGPAVVQPLTLGHVSVNGDTASAELDYQGVATAMRLPLVKEGGAWKIDLLSLVPFGEVLLNVDATVHNQTQAQEVDKLVNRLPLL